jgi:uncharacterized protein (TIGR02266 family)
MDNLPFKERRKYQRILIDTEILCFKSPEDRKRGTGVLYFFSKDISVGGIFLKTAIHLEAGSVVYLKFSLPGLSKTITTQARVINVKGKVVRVNKDDSENVPGMGVEFQHMGFEDKKLIEAFVKEKT